MVTALAGIIAASFAGTVFEQIGYQPTILVCSGITISAALIYYYFFAGYDFRQTVTVKPSALNSRTW